MFTFPIDFTVQAPVVQKVNSPIHQILQLVSVILIHCIEIYPMDSSIQPLTTGDRWLRLSNRLVGHVIQEINFDSWGCRKQFSSQMTLMINKNTIWHEELIFFNTCIIFPKKVYGLLSWDEGVCTRSKVRKYCLKYPLSITT